MQLRPLIWKYEGSAHCLWHGSADGLPRPVSFFITESHTPDEYRLSSDLPGSDTVVCTGLETAKAKAQDLIHNYAFSMIIF